MRLIALVAASSLTMALTASAGTIRVEQSVNGAAFTFHSDWTTTGGTVNITLSRSFGDDIVVYRIRDIDGGVPDDSVGTVTVSGTISTGEVRLLLADGVIDGPTLVWPTDAAQPLSEGLLNLGTANSPSIIFGSTDLQMRSRVAVAVAGDVIGDITAGRITRIQALGRAGPNNSVLGGVVSGDITSTQADESTTWRAPNGALAIGHVRARVALSGDVTAHTPSNFDEDEPYTNTASIDTVTVGDADAASTGVSLTGDLTAEAGKIQSVLVGGPIDQHASRTRRPQFTAGNGVWEVRALDFQGLPRDADFSVDVQANTLEGARFSALPADASVDGYTDVSRRPTYERAIRRIRTAGDFTGIIECENLVSPFYVDTDNQGSSADFGIFIGGTLTGQVIVRDRVLTASIVAESFEDGEDRDESLATVDIGTFLKGSVVARGEAGQVPSIRAGMSPKFDVENPDTNNEDVRWGFIGAWNAPADPPDDPTAVPFNTFREPDSMIRAHALGEVTLSRCVLHGKNYCPRIEATTIDSLTVVHEMELGIVWSGLVDEVEANEFATVGALSIGCARQGVELWISTNDLVCDGNFAGRVHTPSVDAGALWWFGALDPTGVCPLTVPTNAEGSGASVEEDSPRNPSYVTGYNGASIRLTEAESLAGQIVLGPNGAFTSWHGYVWVGASDPQPAEPDVSVRFGRPDPQPRKAPYYETASATLGGGAIGELPFGLHRIDTIPDYADDEERPAPHSLRGVSSGNQPMTLAFYGPITFSAAPATVEFFDLTQSPPAWVEVTEAFTFTVSSNDRSLELRGDGEPALAMGMYRVRPTTALLCDVDGLPVPMPVAALPDLGGAGDPGMYVMLGCQMPGGSLNPADITDAGDNGTGPDGQLTLEDILAFINDYNDGNGCPGVPGTSCNRADLTGDGGTLENPGEPDGQLTLDDILIFNDAFNVGCQDA